MCFFLFFSIFVVYGWRCGAEGSIIFPLLALCTPSPFSLLIPRRLYGVLTSSSSLNTLKKTLLFLYLSLVLRSCLGRSLSCLNASTLSWADPRTRLLLDTIFLTLQFYRHLFHIQEILPVRKTYYSCRESRRCNISLRALPGEVRRCLTENT